MTRRYSEEYIGITAANILCLEGLLEAALHRLGGHVTNMTSSESKTSTHDLESFPPSHYNLSTFTPLSKTYKTYPTRMEDDPIGYHASLRETSRFKKLERPMDGQEDILVKMKRARESENEFEFEFLGNEKGGFVTRQVSIDDRRDDRYDSR